MPSAQEADPVALAFLNAGYNAFVLRYSVSQNCPVEEVYTNAFAEAQEAMDYLHQNAFHEVDTYTSPAKQAMLLRLIIGYYEKSLDALSKDASFNKLAALPVREDIGRFKYTEEDKCAERYEEITAKLNAEIRELTEGGEA